MATETTSLHPKLLGVWSRCIREAAHWSQEALAVSSNLDVRTIQRIEAGKPASIATRRSLALGLGYDNRDIFDDPQFIKTVHEFLETIQTERKKEFEKEYPEHMSIAVALVKNGEDLIRIAEISDAYLFHSDDKISSDAKQAAASIFDYLRDLGDIADDISFSDKITFAKELENMLHELERFGVIAYAGTRSTKMVGENWADKTPMSLTIGYLTVVPEGTNIQRLMVPRRLS